MTDKQFKEYARSLVAKYLESEKIPCTFTLGEIHITGCEWCDRETRTIGVSFSPIETTTTLFVKGFNTKGYMAIFENDHFRGQSEWYVCGQCPDS